MEEAIEESNSLLSIAQSRPIFNNKSAMMEDNTPVSQAEMPSEIGSPTVMRSPINQRESISYDEKALSPDCVTHMAAPNVLRRAADSSPGSSVVHDNNAVQKKRARMICTRCDKDTKIRRFCRGELGVACANCTKSSATCSFLLPRPFVCKHCKRDYLSETHLNVHLKKRHPRQIRQSPKRTSNVDQVPKGSFPQVRKSETPAKRNLDLLCEAIAGPPEELDSQRRRSPMSIDGSSEIAIDQRPSPLQDPQHGETGIYHPESLLGPSQHSNPYGFHHHSLQFGEMVIPNPYQEVKFEIFETYERRNLSPDFIQRTLDRIREDVELYADFTVGKDKDTSSEIQKQLMFMDEVRPLTRLQEIEEETSEIFGIQQSRLVIALRKMFSVKDNSRLEERLDTLAPDVRQAKLPHILCAVVAFYLMQLFTKEDPIREAELRATERTHGPAQAANTVQHSRLVAQESSIFKAKLESQAKKLTRSLYDLIRPLTHWQQSKPHNGSQEQHLEKLSSIILVSLGLAAELEARKGTFSFFWPISGEQFEPKSHSDETEESALNESMDKEQGSKRLVALTLMPGVVRMMDNEELTYAKAAVTVT